MFTELSISRTHCYGDCPVYHVVVNNKGNVQWKGHDFVYSVGETEFKITNSKLKKIEELLESFDYRSFTYPKPDIFSTDHPSCITKVIFDDGYVKEIDHYLGDEQSYNNDNKHSLHNLERFEDKLEQLLGLRKLIKFPPMYLYHVKSMTNSGYESVVLAPNEEEAIQLANRNNSSQQWETQKIGKNTRGGLLPSIVMENNRGEAW